MQALSDYMPFAKHGRSHNECACLRAIRKMVSCMHARGCTSMCLPEHTQGMRSCVESLDDLFRLRRVLPPLDESATDTTTIASTLKDERNKTQTNSYFLCLEELNFVGRSVLPDKLCGT